MYNHLPYIVTHLFMPPKLPLQDDVQPGEFIQEKYELANFIADALERYSPARQEEPKFQHARRMLAGFTAFRSEDYQFDADLFCLELRELKDGGIIALHIEAQNAGLIIERNGEHAVISSFEVSAARASVIGSPGRLVRIFPETSISVDFEKVTGAFCDELAYFLSRIDTEMSPEGFTKARKAGKKDIVEVRDTVVPIFVTEMLAGILRGMGEPVPGVSIEKRIRDDAVDGGKLLPWRRSPEWTVIRVSLQMALLDKSTQDVKMRHLNYKLFMLHLFTDAVNEALVNPQISHELLFMMNVKLARRVQKLTGQIPDALLGFVGAASNAVRTKLDANWDAIRNSSRLNWQPSTINPERDTILKLSSLRPHIEDRLKSSLAPVKRAGRFQPDCRDRIQQAAVFHSALKPGTSADRLALADMEAWVRNHLDDCISMHLPYPDVVITGITKQLSELYAFYSVNARVIYEGSPEDISIMALTLLHLWVALDTVTARIHPFILKFPLPFLPSNMEVLLLSKRCEMEQMQKIKAYIARRNKNSNKSYPSPFARDVSAMCFSVEFYKSSGVAAILHEGISVENTKNKTAKVEEYNTKTARYINLMETYASMECQTYTNWKTGRSGHKKQCRRCRARRDAQSIEIAAYEDLLPTDRLRAEAAVGECCMPENLTRWRDITFEVIVDITGTRRRNAALAKTKPKSTKQEIWTALDFTGLKQFVTASKGRTMLASSAKPYSISHYGKLDKITRHTESSVCARHALNYEIFYFEPGNLICPMDELASVPIKPNEELRNDCTPILESQAYQSLQRSVGTTTHTSNEILATQDLCSDEITLHEYYSFGTLRAGHRLQWRNIAREVVLQVLNFNSADVHTLVLQAAWQVGPNDFDMPVKLIPEAHLDILETKFTMELLEAIKASANAIASNWRGVTALRTYIALVVRIVNFTEDESVQSEGIQLLQQMCQYAIHWARDLSKKLEELESGDQHMDKQTRARRVKEVGELSSWVMETAMTALQVFTVDIAHIPSLLDEPSLASIAVEAAILAHDHLPSDITTLEKQLQALVARHKRVLMVMEPFLRSEATGPGSTMNDAVTRIWETFTPAMRWSAEGGANSRWLISYGGDHGVQVAVDLLRGQLLVNSQPLARLPREYTDHEDFKRLFGQRILQISPSTMPGMIYCSRSFVVGHKVHFKLDGNRLLIRSRAHKTTYEYIPHTTLGEDFGRHYTENYAHWLNLEEGTVEFRKVDRPWDRKVVLLLSFLNDKARTDAILTECNSNARIVDIHSPTAIQISKALSALETLRETRLEFDSKRSKLYVHLDRYNLDFTFSTQSQVIHQSRLYSRNYPNFHVDQDQGIGAFTGLQNMLVLRHGKNASRAVIVPYGPCSTNTRTAKHVDVQVDLSGQKKIVFHKYDIDTEIGRLIGTGKLESQLYKIYLHAITSHFLPDSLTGRTGTEEALYQLDSAATRSFQEISATGQEILLLISNLTPKRAYYPAHLKVMQQPGFSDNLPQLSQHPRFCVLVHSIMEYAQTLEMFKENPEELPNTTFLEDLHAKYTVRNSAYYADGFNEYETGEHDAVYVPRHSPQFLDREQRVCEISTLTNLWSTNLDVRNGLFFGTVRSWTYPIIGPDSRYMHSSLRFDWAYLEEYGSFLPDKWCALQSFLGSCDEEEDKHRISFFLSTLAYSQNADMPFIEGLLALATVPSLRKIAPPEGDLFDLSCGTRPTRARLEAIVRNHCVPYGIQSAEYQLKKGLHETDHAYNLRRVTQFQERQSEFVDLLVTNIMESWPQKANSRTGNDYLDFPSALEATHPYTSACEKAQKFERYLVNLDTHLKKVKPASITIERIPFNRDTFTQTYSTGTPSMTLSRLLESRDPPQLPNRPRDGLKDLFNKKRTQSEDHSKLDELLGKIEKNTTSPYESMYIGDLRHSFESLNSGEVDIQLQGDAQRTAITRRHRDECKAHVNETLQSIVAALRKPNALEEIILQNAGLWPRLSKGDILQQLSNASSRELSWKWRNAILDYGKSLSTLQRAQRVFDHGPDKLELTTELGNVGHDAWRVDDNAEWLLFELENNLLIRPGQIETGKEMMSPSGGGNSVMQLNMGEGKTSVIVPIVASTLADGSCLVRIVVIRPLAKSMFQQLVRKLGGLLNRRVYCMPFNRKMDLDVAKVEQIRSMYEECMRNKGVLLIQPEHMLSFKLMGYERLFAGKDKLSIGQTLTATQTWLDQHSRDILDESDEVLNVKFELVYAIGMQKNVAFAPDRWKIILDLLSSVRRHAYQVQKLHPDGVEIVSGSKGSFPRVRILSTAAGETLIKRLAGDACNGKLESTDFRLNSELMWKFVRNPELDKENAAKLRQLSSNSELIWDTLLLLKGLIAGGVIQFAFSKRWRVNYGLDLSRTMLAVPYRAKDCPVSRAEFSHPDSTIVLTALSYYYGGLTDEQLFFCIERLLSLDSREEEYVRWMGDAPTLHESFRTHHGINLRNHNECTERIFPSLRSAKAVVDFYLTQFVFPKELKEYPHKLSASGWDVACEKPKGHPTTGFSGTNDSRYVLPLSVKQLALTEQEHTNAAVLNCILRKENSYEDLFRDASHKGFDAKILLNKISRMSVRVLIDVGAQILEMTNREVAHYWLFEASKYIHGDKREKPKAVVYFEDNDELSVLTKDNVVEPFMISSYSNQLEKCFVYLDEIHTRGTDLKLPTDYRAAVTLGPGLTKDRLVQACMRMRKLGKGQSLIFCAPDEVQRSILETRKVQNPLFKPQITVMDVLQWTIAETCSLTKKMIPLWAHQGIRYQKQDNIRQRWRGRLTENDASKLLEKEAKTLDERYGDIARHEDLELRDLEMEQQMRIDEIQERCSDFGLRVYRDVALEEEQERELSPENEREIETVRPPRVEASVHTIDPFVSSFVSSEGVVNSSTHVPSAFASLTDTTIGAFALNASWPKNILASNDFTNTVKEVSKRAKKYKEKRDYYLRPVHWILKSANSDMLVVISPFEANLMLPTIRNITSVSLSVYSARASKSSPRLDQLTRFCVGKAIGIQQKQGIPLNIFAGQIYFAAHAEYIAFCQFLGLACGNEQEGEIKPRTEIDGFIPIMERLKRGMVDCPFFNSPAGFVLGLARIRRKGLAVDRSHVGRVCSGGVLEEADI